jgi:hypothetical protein
VVEKRLKHYKNNGLGDFSTTFSSDKLPNHRISLGKQRILEIWSSKPYKNNGFDQKLTSFTSFTSFTCFTTFHQSFSPSIPTAQVHQWRSLVKSCEIGKTCKTGETGYSLVETIVFIRFRAPDLPNPLFS